MLTESRYGPSNIIVGSVLYEHPVWTYQPGNVSSSVGWAFHGPYNDVLAYTLGRMENLSIPVDLADWAGYTSGREVTHRGRKPVQAYLAPDGVRNFNQYISDLREFFGGWNFAGVDSALSLAGRENPVQHSNLFGHVQNGIKPSDYHRPGRLAPREEDGPFPTLFPGPIVNPYYNMTIQGSALSDVTAIACSWQPDPGSFYPLCRLTDGLRAYQEWFRNGPVLETVAHSGYQTLRYFALNWVEYEGFVSEYSYTVNLLIDNGADPYVYSRTYDVKYEFWLEHVAPPPLNTEFTLRDKLAIRGRVKYVQWEDMARLRTDPVNWVPTTSIHGVYTSTSATFDTVGTNWIGAAGVSQPGFTELVGILDTGALYRSGSDKTLIDFEDKVRSFSVDSNALYFFSSADAVSMAFPQFESNHIEGLLEVRSLSSLLDPVTLAKRMLAQAAKSKKLSFKMLLNLLADAKLTYSLGIAPTIGDALDIAQRARNLRVRYTGDLSKPVTQYGKFILPPDPQLWDPFGDTYVVARTKLRVALSEDSWWMAMMPLHAMNLLPTFSNVYDLLPLSFVLDYFSNVGDSLEAVDNALFFLGLEVEYVVHSTSFIYPFSDVEDCEPYGFTCRKDGLNNDAGYKIYNRWVGAELPLLTPTRFNVFGYPKPNYSILGSLLYKFTQ